MASSTRPPLPPKPCAVCGQAFTGRKPAKGKRAPEVCGRSVCWAVRYWGQEEWDGRKRTAEALVSVHQGMTGLTWWTDPATGTQHPTVPPLSALDVEALRRGR